MLRPPPRPTLFPYTTLFRSEPRDQPRYSRLPGAGLAYNPQCCASPHFQIDVVRSSHRAFVAKRSEEHTSELQSQSNLVCRLLLEKKKKHITQQHAATRTLDT